VIVLGYWARQRARAQVNVVQRKTRAHLWKMRDGKVIKLMLCTDEA